MDILFSKMHGLGNDFVVIDAINQQIRLSPDQIRFIADRHLGVGCDQLLLVEPPTDDSVLFTYRIFNSDGNEVEQCGNGARCFARFVSEKNLTRETNIPVATNSGRIILRLEDNGLVTVNMGVPRFEPEQIPFVSTSRAERYSIDVDGRNIEVGVTSMGNPHVVMLVDDVNTAQVETLGPLLESHSRFPKRVNVGFMQIVDQNKIKLRVYERGVGETQACGTGACAAMVIARCWKLVNENVQVTLTGGTLNISWAAEGQPVMMTGPAQTVFEGSISI